MMTTKHVLALAALLLTASTRAQPAPEPIHPSPDEIVAASDPAEWRVIAPEDMLVMRLIPDTDGQARRVVIQLMSPPFSQGWVGNIRTLARAHWWDGMSVNRVQDNYVVQWGDPAEEEGERKPLPEGLEVQSERAYLTPLSTLGDAFVAWSGARQEPPLGGAMQSNLGSMADMQGTLDAAPAARPGRDSYAEMTGFADGWPLASDGAAAWPVHCYAMVGVGRDYSPDTGSGAELYAVIGHAPRHLDRNIALVGRVIEGMEHLSSLPRGTAALGVYESAGERIPIASLRLASDLPEAERPAFEYLLTDSVSFARYAHVRANRRDPFFIRPAGGADICNVPVPIRSSSRK